LTLVLSEKIADLQDISGFFFASVIVAEKKKVKTKKEVNCNCSFLFLIFSFGKRGEIKETKINRLFYLVDKIAGQQHIRNMRLQKCYLSCVVGIRGGMLEKINITRQILFSSI
jgi:hypothetical protein